MFNFDVISRGTDNRTVVTTAGTPVQLTTAVSPCAGVYITAESDNTGVIAVGFTNSVRAALTAQKGTILGARERIFLPVEDASLIWLDASISTDGVSYSIVYRTQATGTT